MKRHSTDKRWKCELCGSKPAYRPVAPSADGYDLPIYVNDDRYCVCPVRCPWCWRGVTLTGAEGVVYPWICVLDGLRSGKVLSLGRTGYSWQRQT